MDFDNPSYQPVPAAWDPPTVPLVTNMEITRDMLVQRSNAVCFNCGMATASLALNIFESQTIANSANPPVNLGQAQMHFESMQASLVSAESALRACSQCGLLPRVETSALLSGAAIVQKPKSTVPSPSPGQQKARQDGRGPKPRKTIPAGEKRVRQIKKVLGQPRAQSTTIPSPKRDISRFTRPNPTSNTATDIFLNLAMNMKQGTTNEKFIFACLCKVLGWIGEPVRELMSIDGASKSTIRKRFDHFTRGSLWANKLLEELYWRGWGHQAFELLLFWNKSVYIYSSFAVVKKLQNRFVDELSKPEYINLFPPVPGRAYKSLPILIHATLRNTVSYDHICKALGYGPKYIGATKDELVPTISTLSTPQGIDASYPNTYDGEMGLSEGKWDVGSACNTLTVPDAWSGEASRDFDMTVNTDQSAYNKYKKQSELELQGLLDDYYAPFGVSTEGMWLTG